MKSDLWLLAAISLWTTPALAEHHEEAADTATEDAAKTAEGVETITEADASADNQAEDVNLERGDAAQQALAAIALPAKAQALRTSGMSDGEVTSALNATNEAGFDAGQAGELLDAAQSKGDGDVWEGGFGTWVKAQLNDGKRGKVLAEALKKEQTTRKQARDAAKAAGTWKGSGDKEVAKDAGADKAKDAAKLGSMKPTDPTVKTTGSDKGDGSGKGKGKGK